MDMDRAIPAHAEWKTKLRGAIAKKEQLDARSIAGDHACELGKWLHGEGKSLHGRLPSFGDCVEKHAAFHREAGKVAVAINAGKFTDAEVMLGASTPYAAASTAVGVAIRILRKDASI